MDFAGFCLRTKPTVNERTAVSGSIEWAETGDRFIGAAVVGGNQQIIEVVALAPCMAAFCIRIDPGVRIRCDCC